MEGEPGTGSLMTFGLLHDGSAVRELLGRALSSLSTTPPTASTAAAAADLHGAATSSLTAFSGLHAWAPFRFRCPEALQVAFDGKATGGHGRGGTRREGETLDAAARRALKDGIRSGKRGLGPSKRFELLIGNLAGPPGRRFHLECWRAVEASSGTHPRAEPGGREMVSRYSRCDCNLAALWSSSAGAHGVEYAGQLFKLDAGFNAQSPLGGRECCHTIL